MRITRPYGRTVTDKAGITTQWCKRNGASLSRPMRPGGLGDSILMQSSPGACGGSAQPPQRPRGSLHSTPFRKWSRWMAAGYLDAGITSRP